MNYKTGKKVTVEGIECIVTSTEYSNTMIVSLPDGELVQVKLGNRLTFTTRGNDTKDYNIKFAYSRRKRNVATRLRNA